MKKIRPYFVITFVLLLVTGPWLQTTGARMIPKETACNCCMGPCQGCCCSETSNSHETKSAGMSDECRCEVSNLPVLPVLPMEIHEHRLVDKSNEAVTDTYISAQPRSERGIPRFAIDKSPPQVSSRPAYVLFSSLLI